MVESKVNRREKAISQDSSPPDNLPFSWQVGSSQAKERSQVQIASFDFN